MNNPRLSIQSAVSEDWGERKGEHGLGIEPKMEISFVPSLTELPHWTRLFRIHYRAGISLWSRFSTLFGRWLNSTVILLVC